MKHFLLSTRLVALLSVSVISFPVLAAPQQTAKAVAVQNTAPTSLPAATQAKLRALLSNSKVADGHIGLCIQALGKVPNAQVFPSKPYTNNAKPILFQQNANSRFMPASNLKLYTAALALHTLGSEYSFTTRVRREGINGTGDQCRYLVIQAGGDPSLATEDIDKMAEQVVATGLKVVEKGIQVENILYRAETFGGRYPDGWTLDDSIWYYGPEVSALSVNRNQVDVYITGGAKKGDPATLRVEPPLPSELGFEIRNLVTTGEANQKTNVIFERGNADLPISRVLTISGEIAPGETYTDGIAVPDAPKWIAILLKNALEKRGVKFESADSVSDSWSATIAEHKSPPLRVLLQKFLKTSDNLYGEMLLRNSYALIQEGVYPIHSSVDERAHSNLRRWLRQNNIDDSALRFEDGSGLSRYNIITPRATVGLLAAVEKLRGGDAFWNALPIAGVDGTLKKRMKSTLAQNNVRAKTGTFSIVSTLSGYVTTRDGHRLAVSLLTNFVRNGDDARELQNQVFAALANTSWQTASPTHKN